jgi:hypothetical protein
LCSGVSEPRISTAPGIAGLAYDEGRGGRYPLGEAVAARDAPLGERLRFHQEQRFGRFAEVLDDDGEHVERG